MVEFRQLIISFILIALFTFTLIASGVIMQTNNNVKTTIVDEQDPRTAPIRNLFGNLSADLLDQQNLSQGQVDEFTKEAPQEGTNVFLFASIVAAAKIIVSSISLLSNVLFSFLVVTLGLGEGVGLVIMGSFMAILLVTILFLGYKVFKIGT